MEPPDGKSILSLGHRVSLPCLANSRSCNEIINVNVLDLLRQAHKLSFAG